GHVVLDRQRQLYNAFILGQHQATGRILIFRGDIDLKHLSNDRSIPAQAGILDLFKRTELQDNCPLFSVYLINTSHCVNNHSNHCQYHEDTAEAAIAAATGAFAAGAATKQTVQLFLQLLECLIQIRRTVIVSSPATPWVFILTSRFVPGHTFSPILLIKIRSILRLPVISGYAVDQVSGFYQSLCVNQQAIYGRLPSATHVSLSSGKDSALNIRKRSLLGIRSSSSDEPSSR